MLKGLLLCAGREENVTTVEVRLMMTQFSCLYDMEMYLVRHGNEPWAISEGKGKNKYQPSYGVFQVDRNYCTFTYR